MKALRSIAEVERELRGEGFFEGGADGLVADLYLGYGLSRALRRTQVPSPPEPCPLPLAAVHVRPADEPLPRAGPYHVGDWERTWDEASYAAAVEAVREAIAAGDVYQVNLVQHLSAPFDGDPAGVAAALAPLRPLEPRPFAGDGWTVVSGLARALPRAARVDGSGRSRSRARARSARRSSSPLRRRTPPST